MRNKISRERGVALIIVLLVTALLIALVFEFAYGTRISLRGATNFRDSQRAYYLARSGVHFAGLLLSDNLQKKKLQDNLEQRDWQAVPLMTADPDVTLQVRWEDESGKINIENVSKGYSDAYNRLSLLFTKVKIEQSILDQISQWQQEKTRKFYLVTELHRFLSDEDFSKIQDDVTLAPIGTKININTASADVLQSLGLDAGMVSSIIDKRKDEPFTTDEKIVAFLGPTLNTQAGMLGTTSDYFKVNSYATAGGYTAQVEAVIHRLSGGAGADILYWRVL
jgi:general secretion pathway protein K